MLNPNLLDICLKHDHPGNLHPIVQADLLLEAENKQRDCFLANVHKCQQQELLNRVHVRLNQNLSHKDSKPVPILDNNPDSDPSPNFVFLGNDGEFANSSVHCSKKLIILFKTNPDDLHPTETPTWKEFEVPLLNKNREQQLYDKE